MPTNLPPECVALELEYLKAKTPTEKIHALQKYLAAIPKHKGTERLCARLKTKLAKLRLEVEKKQKQRTSGYTKNVFSIKKEGAAQIVLLGLTGSGRSSLLKLLTKAKPKIQGHPYTTTAPIPGMMYFEDIQIQLIEAPALFKGAGSGSGRGSKILGLARNADGLLLVVDLSAPNPSLQLKTIIDELNKCYIYIKEKAGKIQIERKEAGGIQLVCFNGLNTSPQKIKNLLRKHKINHAVVKIWGKVQLGDIAQAILRTPIYKSTIVLANKIDVAGAKEKLRKLKHAFSHLKIIATSTISKTGISQLPQKIFESLNILRIYTKRPRQPPSTMPMIMKEGATVADAARMIHKHLHQEFKYAKIWGSSKYPGERVGRSYLLTDRDVLEIRT